MTVDTIIYLNSSGSGTIDVSYIDNGSTDNIGIADLNLNITSFDCSNVGYNTVTLTAEDAAGNSTLDSAVVTVLDTVSPVAVCQDITIYLDSTGNAFLLPLEIDGGSADACGIAELSVNVDSFSYENMGENIVELTVIDNSSNLSTCSSVVTVVDTMGAIF